MNRIGLGRIRSISGFLAAVLLAGSFFGASAYAEQPVSAGDAVTVWESGISAGDVGEREPEVSAGDSGIVQELDAPENDGAAAEGLAETETEAETETKTESVSETVSEAEKMPEEELETVSETEIVPETEAAPEAEDKPAEYSIMRASDTGALILATGQIRFVKKKTSLYTGQKDVFAGTIKYSTEQDYIHNFTAVAYDKRGEVQKEISCAIKNEDELYLSVGTYVIPGSYKIVIYAGNGEAVSDSPQAGSLYQANTSFTLTVKAGIYHLDTSGITTQIAVSGKKVTFSAVPKGMGYGGKTKTQKFTYEIKSAVPSGSGYTTTSPSSKVSGNITVSGSGKVTVWPEYPVDMDASQNYFAIVIKAADYAENETTATVYVQVMSTAIVPTEIYLTSGSGVKFGSNIFADRANGAGIVVLDQNGNNINQYVTITPADNAKHTKGAYVGRSGSGAAYFYVRKPGSYTIKATTKDGRKKSKSLKVKIFAPEDAEAIYSLHGVTCGGLSAGSAVIESGTVSYSAPKGSVIKMVMGGRIDDINYWNSRWFNWKYSLQGGKLKADGDYWLITPTAQTCELTVWAKANPDKTWTIRFNNKSWDAYDPAPRLTLTGGKLYSNRYTGQSELEYYYNEYYGKEEYEVPDQQLCYQYDSGTYDSVGIVPVSKSAPTLRVSDLDPAQRTFKLDLSPGNDIKAGSYKYKIAFYKGEAMMCAPASVTVKINASSAVKITASYTMKLSQADSVELKSKPAGFVPDYDRELLNANTGGRANDFNKYFELAYFVDPAGTKSAVIRFKDSVSEEEREGLRGKKLTGYVRYSYYYGYSYMKNKTAKVTIKVK